MNDSGEQHSPPHCWGSFCRPAPSSRSPPSFIVHFNSRLFSKVSEWKARFQVQADKPEDKSTWSALCPRQLYTSILSLPLGGWGVGGGATPPPRMPALEFHLAEPHHAMHHHQTGRFMLIMDQKSRLQRLPRHRTCANSNKAQAGNFIPTFFIHWTWIYFPNLMRAFNNNHCLEVFIMCQGLWQTKLFHILPHLILIQHFKASANTRAPWRWKNFPSSQS